MEKKKDFIVYLKDMLESSLKGISFIQNLTYDEFKKDEKTQYALIRAIEIIGEASTKVPKTVKDKFDEIPWREVKGMPNKLIHDYFGVDTQIVWKTAKEDLPFLKSELLKIINELEKIS